MKDTKAILNKILQINDDFPGGLPANSVNLGCDVIKMYPNIDQEDVLAAIRRWLRLYPNPDGLPTELILDLGKPL